MEISLWLVLVNTAYFMLIWLVQLVIYPGLLHYSEKELKTWHPIYTLRASLVTGPLLLLQLILYSIVIFKNPTFFSIAGIVLVIVASLVTFLLAIPLHAKIDEQRETFNHRQRLVTINWYRTAAWTGSFILSLIEYGS